MFKELFSVSSKLVVEQLQAGKVKILPAKGHPPTVVVETVEGDVASV